MTPPPLPPPLPPKFTPSSLPPRFAPPLPGARQTPQKPPRRTRKIFIWAGLLFAGLVVFIVVGVPIIALFITRNRPPLPKGPGEEALHQAIAAIMDDTHGNSHGNNDKAIALAARLSERMKLVRETMFKGGSKDLKEFSLTTHDNFVVYCQLNEHTCVFLIHVPEMRRYGSTAEDTLAKVAYRVAAATLDMSEDTAPRKLAIATRGNLLYSRVLIGNYHLNDKEPMKEVATVSEMAMTVPELNAFFVPESAVAVATP